MLLNTWLLAAKRQLFGSSANARGSERRNSIAGRRSSGPGEELESRQLLTALVINDLNVDDFVDTSGTLSVDSADITGGGFDGLVIESVSLSSTGGAIAIDLRDIPLNRLAIETVDVTAFSGTAVDINLTNVTGNRTISLEDINVSSATGLGLNVNLDGTNAYALTIEDNAFPGVAVRAVNGSVVTHGIVTENTIDAPAGSEGVLLEVNSGGRADNFQIINNGSISTSDQNAVRINLDDAPVDGLVIANNTIGNEPGADVSFRAEGDTFNQPFELTNRAGDSEQLEQFVLDLRPLGLVFDIDNVDGKQFTVDAASSAGITFADPANMATLSENNQVLTLNFSAFGFGETLLFTIDVDTLPAVLGDPPQNFSAFGNDLIGAAVQFDFGAGTTSSAKQVNGVLIGDADVLSAAEFVRGDGSETGFHGVNLDLSNSPLTNASIAENDITGVAGHGVFVDARGFSDVSAVFSNNNILAGGQDGINFNLVDSNFTGAILENTISLNSGNGIKFQPSVTRTGSIEAAVNSNPFEITSTNHQLETGDQIIVQGIVNDDPTVNHPGNGLHTVVRVDNNRFRLLGVDGTALDVSYAGGGTWYVPDFRDETDPAILTGNPADFPRGLVSIDLQATEPQGRIQNIQAPVGGDAVITSLNHNLSTGDRVRISRADGTGISGAQSFKITVINEDSFSLDGQPLNGVYDTSGGLATWTTNVVEDVTNAGEIVVTSQGHGLATGDQIRVVGVRLTDPTLTSNANGRFTVTRISNDAFVLQGTEGNGDYVVGSGYWVPFSETTFTGDELPQLVFGNSVTGNKLAGLHVDLSTGTRFNGDIVSNTFSDNEAKGVYIESHSFGLGTELPLDPNDDRALPSVQDISFDVNIGTSSTDGNQINSNNQAGVVIEALDFATGSFEIRGNQINSNQDDTGIGPVTPEYVGDGIVVRLDSDQLSAESVAFLSESVIADNQIGVDARGNEGNGLSFSMADRTKIQDLEVLDNSFLNNQLDGFHFVRTEDADLNAIVFDDNAVTNNEGDGFDIFAENTVKDRLDFRILDSVIDDNGEYGIRVDAQADARLQIDIEGSTIRENGRVGNGFNPDDNDMAHPDGPAQGEAGGIGIHGFQQVDVVLNIIETTVERNIGDGLSIDAENFFDTIIIDARIVDSKLNLNTRTGLRSIGASFGQFEFTRTDFNGNGTDGARLISNVDTDDFFNRRVGGQDIDVTALGNDFQGNVNSGLVLGQGVSASLGNGDPTANFANRFGGRLSEDLDATRVAGAEAGNGEDGLKVVQDAGPYLRDATRRRVIQASGNEFTFNVGDGIDIGHHVVTEPAGNVLHGHEVVSDTDVIIDDANISNNQGDGLEYLADNVLRVFPGVGSGQDDIVQPNISSVTITNSDIKNNMQRGVDVLNRFAEDSRVTLTNNEIIGNGFSGIYVVNTSNNIQRQSGPEDPLAVEYPSGDDIPGATSPNEFYSVSGGFTIDSDLVRSPNIELRVQDNLIESNGTADRDSTVPINTSDDSDDGAVQPNISFHHSTDLVKGTLGGLTVRVGTADGAGRISAADPEEELGRSGIDAEIWNNNFDGNFGADVYFDNFVSIVPYLSGDRFTNEAPSPDYRWNRGYRDPLARLDLVFRENTGNSLDVINGFAFLDNDEEFFKRRISNGNPQPNPDGVFLTNGRYDRNATRTIGYFNNVGDVPSSDFIDLDDGSLAFFGTGGILGQQLWAYDGWGTPTWRVESDFDFANFPQTDLVSGFSDFYDEVNLGGALAEEPYQWDTGAENVPDFDGETPYSLDRGDVFGVLDGEAPILADQLEDNDSFVGAYDLGAVSGTGFLVNAQTTDGRLSIDRKGDRDYYRFIAAGTGSLDVNLAATDVNGATLQFLIYEVDPALPSGEVAMIQAANGAPIRSSVAAGNTGAITVDVVAGRTYFIEVISDENSNLGRATAGKNFVYGTVRSYTLSIDAPVGTLPVLPESAPTVVDNEIITSPGVTAAISIADASPFVASITDVAPDPIGTSVNSLTVTFSEDVTGVDLTDFELSRNGILLDLSGAILNGTSPETYEITNLSPLTSEAGTYELTVLVATSGIVDTDLEPLVVGVNDTETWTLNNIINFTGDVADNVPGDGIIGDAAGNASLRAAVMETNANPGEDIIRLAPGNYVLSIGGRFEDNARTGDLDITDKLTIIGTGTTALDTVIDAADVDRVFHVFPGVELTLENLTVQGGEAYDGAGIFIEGRSVSGGPLLGSGGIVQITDVNLINNEAYNQGGGIYNLGSFDAVRSSISMNVAGSRGGGIFNHGGVDLLNTTISTNTAVSRGGGIYNEVASTSVNPNQRPEQTFGSVDALNVTIAFNTAEAEGGGIFQEQNGSVRIGNSIIDQNSAKSSPDISGALDSQSYNFIGRLDGVVRTAFLLTPNDVVGDETDSIATTAGLNAISSASLNGTWFHSLAADAFAVDTGSKSLYALERGLANDDNVLLPERDQTGGPRLVEGDGNGLFEIDRGASERFISQPVAIFTPTPDPAGVNEPVTLDGSGSTHTLVPGTSKIVQYEWDFDYDGIPANFNVDQTGEVTSASYPAVGDVTIALRVTDDTGSTDIHQETLSVSAPQAPVITAPFSAGTSDLTPTIVWDAGAGTFSLTVTDVATGSVVLERLNFSSPPAPPVDGQTDPNADLRCPVEIPSGPRVHCFTPAATMAPGTYEAVVTAINASGREDSVPYQFNVIQMALTDPANLAVEFDTTPELTFTAIPNAERYQIWVSQLSDQTNADGSRDSIGIPINDSNVNAAQALIPGTNLAGYEPPTSLGEGYFRVWTRAFEANGNAGHWSFGAQFQITKPTITGPVLASRATLDSTPTITWTDIGAAQYEIWLTQRDGSIDGTAITSPVVVFNGIVQGTSYTPDLPLGNGNFRVWVRAVDDTGEAGLWSEAYDFTKDLNSGPTLLSPIEKVTVTDRTPQFEWQALDGASHYELWVNNINTGATRIIHNTNVPHVDGAATITYTDPDVVLRNASYRWWVRAFNTDGEAAGWTAPEQFFVPTPVISSPIGAVAGTSSPTFSWTGVPEYVRYELWVNNDTTGLSRVIYEPDLTTTTFTPALPLENGDFRVWVRGFDALGNASQWSNPAAFTVNATVSNAPTPISPASRLFVFGNSPQFVWSPLADIAQYEILVKRLLGTSQPEVIRDFTQGTVDLNGDLTHTTTTSLATGTYRWWIRGLNADGTPGPWSQPLDFRVSDNSSPQSVPDTELLLATYNTEEAWTDDVHSITVHPAAVVVAHVSDESMSPAVDATATTTPKAAGTSEAVDAVMQELAFTDLLLESEISKPDMNIAVVTANTDAAVSPATTSDSGKSGTAAGLGLIVAGFGRRRQKNGRRDDAS